DCRRTGPHRSRRPTPAVPGRNSCLGARLPTVGLLFPFETVEQRAQLLRADVPLDPPGDPCVASAGAHELGPHRHTVVRVALLGAVAELGPRTTGGDETEAARVLARHGSVRDALDLVRTVPRDLAVHDRQ